MSASVSDLKNALENVTQQRPHLSDPAGAARRSGKRVRRGRIVVVACGTALVVVGALGFINLAHQRTPTPAAPVDSAKPSVRLPAYQQGYRLIDSVETADPQGAELTFVVGDRRLMLANTCAGPTGHPRSEILLNGDEYSETSCSDPIQYNAGSGGSAMGAMHSNGYWDFSPGTTITLRQQWTDGQPREGSLWSMGLYEKVPLAEYPYRGSPTDIKKIPTDNFHRSCSGILETSSRDGTLTFGCHLKLLGGHLDIHSQLNAPGRLSFTAKGHKLWSHAAWRYGSDIQNYRVGLPTYYLQQGDTVKVTAEWKPFTNATSQAGVTFSSQSRAP